jgi:hypothetical protein
MRKSVAAWQLLQRLNQSEVGMIFNAESGRYHFLQHCRVTDPVDPRSVEQLAHHGFVRRERSAIPVYVITEKGKDALKQRETPEELVPADDAASTHPIWND